MSRVDRPSAPGVLGHTDGGDAIGLRYEDRTLHAAVIGKSGFGKTTVLEHLILEDLTLGTGAIVLDAHGDLTERIVELTPAEASERLIVVEMNDEHPFGLNLYECHSPAGAAVDTTIDNVIEVFKKLFLDERNFYPVIEDGLRNSAHVIIANGWTLAEVPLLFRNAAVRREALCAVTDREVLGYWSEYDEMTPREQREQRRAVLNKVSPFLQRRSVRLMVSQQRTTIPFDEVFDSGATLLLRLAGGSDPTARLSVQFLGLVFLSVLSNIVARRASVPRERRKRVHLYLDEYQRFASTTTQQMLDEFRKYEIGITVAHQGLDGIGDRPPRVASLLLFQVDGADSEKLALNFDTTPRRTREVLKPRVEPSFTEQRREKWATDSDKAEHKRYSTVAEQRRQDMMRLASEHKIWENMLRYYTDIDVYKLPTHCNCGRHESSGGDFFSEYPANHSLAAANRINRFFNPVQAYFNTQLRDLKNNGEQVTASGLVGLYHLQDEPLPGETKLPPPVLCERYYLLPEAVNYAPVVQRMAATLRTSPETVERLRPLFERVQSELKEFYARTHFHLELASDPPAVGSERQSVDWLVRGHWLTSLFPTVLTDVQTAATALRLEKEKASS